MNDSKDMQELFPDLFRKYLTNSCSGQEAEEILNFIENPENSDFLRQEAIAQYISTDQQGNDALKTPEDQAAMDRVLERVHNQVHLQEKEIPVVRGTMKKFMNYFARAAAILLVPLVVYSFYITLKQPADNQTKPNLAIWQTVKTAAGMQTDFILPDGSHVWLNAGSELQFPVAFANDIRQVKLSGEAFFDVKKDPVHPFIVNAGKMNIEVKGTRFNVCNYPDEPGSEITLESGSVRLFSGNYKDNKTMVFIKPGEQALLSNSTEKLSVSRVDVDKHTSWKEGQLIFRDDTMDEVVRKLNRKFNVDIILQDPEIREYVYTATFSNESLGQILGLLKISAPVSYVAFKPVQLADHSFSKQKIIITKRR